MSAPTALHGGTTPLAALTSVFTPPCPTSWLLTTTRSFSQYPAFPTTGPASCDPPSWRTNIARAGFHYYSPAICPRGFVVGPNCGVTKTRTDEGFPAIAPGETAAYCVPIGLTCTTDITDFRGGVWGFAREASTAGALVTVGPAIQIRWVEADLSMLETHPLTPGLKLARTGPETTLVRSTTSSSPAKETNTEPEKRPAPDSGEDSSGSLVTDTNTRPPDETLTHIFADPTSTLGPANTASGSNGSGGLGSLDRGTSIAVIVVVTVVAGIALWTAAFFLVRRYKGTGKPKGSPSSTECDDESGLGPRRRHTSAYTGMAKSIVVSPMSELDSGPAAIGSTPNPAELEGDILVRIPSRPRMTQRSWLKSPSLQPPQASPGSMPSTRSTRRTVRESFGEKVNDPAAALGRLRIPNPLAMGRPSPSSASPSTRSFWRLPRSPRSPAAAAGTPGRLSAQLPKPSPRSRFSENPSRISTPGRGRPGWQDDADKMRRDATTP
ncbi:hypothetical protein C8A00DRAFT_46442 [Chaetomidium leptoderma]|uniref:Uncharacterized protein n=1 Tax=Chaetomidium leptoderma TaxID=669021 RepID=A0AAN6VGI5_9PEZI|nr:hypothetical protein C8A00DRAFT_46442 [Chaetomidium leptoderma]